MAEYRLYFVDRFDHIRDAVELEGIDDAEAIRKAEKRSDGRKMELWRRARKVMTFTEAPHDA
jgi:hypothetical protein